MGAREGFTLIELMIVIAIVGVLSAIAVPRFKTILHKSQEAMTLGNLAAIRAAINSYVAVTEGQYPTDNLNSLITGGYLRAIPRCHVPPNGDGVFAGHNPDYTIAGGPHTTFGSNVAKWYYFNDPGEPQWFGKVVVGCGHLSSKGIPWDEH